MAFAVAGIVSCSQPRVGPYTASRSSLGHRIQPAGNRVATRLERGPRRPARQQQQLLAAAAAETPATSAGPDVDAAISTLRQAAKDAGVPAKAVFDALRTLDKAKPKGIEWQQVLAGSGPGVRRWRLAYTAGGKELAQAVRGGSSKGGMYWSVPAAAIGYRADGVIENGVYLGWVASLRFEGNYELKSNKIGFEFSKLGLSIGPLKLPPFTIKKNPTTSWDNPAKADGLFVLVYGDDEIMVARGKSGGIALWQRASPTWQLENGIA